MTELAPSSIFSYVIMWKKFIPWLLFLDQEVVDNDHRHRERVR